MTEHKPEAKSQHKMETKAEIAEAEPDVGAPTPKAEAKLPEYVCHKKVRAGKITAIDTGAGGANAELGADIHAGDPDVVQHVDKAWFDKHTPEVGGYLVLYEDGYVSYSPAGPFESGYTLAGGHNAPTKTHKV